MGQRVRSHLAAARPDETTRLVPHILRLSPGGPPRQPGRAAPFLIGRAARRIGWRRDG
jgi:hypothetical protein